MNSDRFPVRAFRRWWRCALADQATAEEVRDDDTGLADGLVLAAIASLAVVSTSRDWITWALAIPVGLFATALLGMVLAITIRWVKSQATWWEATTMASITMLPLVLAVIPVVGVFIGVIAWLLALILILRHISYMAVNDAAIAVLMALAMVVIITLGLLFAINTAL